MSKYRVTFGTGASLTMYVDAVETGDEDEDREAAIEAAYEELPRSICAQCSGWGRDYSLDLGDWELEEDNEYMKAVEKVEED